MDRAQFEQCIEEARRGTSGCADVMVDGIVAGDLRAAVIWRTGALAARVLFADILHAHSQIVDYTISSRMEIITGGILQDPDPPTIMRVTTEDDQRLAALRSPNASMAIAIELQRERQRLDGILRTPAYDLGLMWTIELHREHATLCNLPIDPQPTKRGTPRAVFLPPASRPHYY